MEEFIEEIKKLTTENGVSATSLDVTLAIEQFQQIRNYPSSYSEEKKLDDMQNFKSTIAMAVVEIDAKQGVENQTAHSENGTSRTYSKDLLAFQNVVGFANCI